MRKENKEFKPNHFQIRALRWFKNDYGRMWKSKLRECWISGKYPPCSPNDLAALQQLRNDAGPSWLKTFRIDKQK